MESSSRAPALEMNEKEKEMAQQESELFFLKFWRVSDDRIVAGSLFNDAGPATANAWSLKLVLEHGTWRSPCAAEWSRERTESSAFDQQSSLRYSGAVPWTALKTRRQNQKFIWGRGSLLRTLPFLSFLSFILPCFVFPYLSFALRWPLKSSKGIWGALLAPPVGAQQPHSGWPSNVFRRFSRW